MHSDWSEHDVSASMLLTRCVKALGCAMSVCKVGFGLVSLGGKGVIQRLQCSL